MSEHAVASHFEYVCSLAGAQRLAYVPVVASGCVVRFLLPSVSALIASPASPNSLIIHYTSNNQIIQDDEMILMDAGCEYKSVEPFLPYLLSKFSFSIPKWIRL